jgi:hypothetical protein
MLMFIHSGCSCGFVIAVNITFFFGSLPVVAVPLGFELLIWYLLIPIILLLSSSLYEDSSFCSRLLEDDAVRKPLPLIMFLQKIILLL